MFHDQFSLYSVSVWQIQLLAWSQHGKAVSLMEISCGQMSWFPNISMKIHSNNILLICVVAQMPVIRAQLTNLILKMVGGCANQEAGICTVLQHVRHHCKTN